MGEGLIFFGMPLASGFGLTGMIFVLRHVGPRAVFADGNAAEPAVMTVAVQNAPVVAQFSTIPAGVNIPTEQIGDLIQGGPFSAARGGNHRAGWILAMGGITQVLQFPEGAGIARNHFIEMLQVKIAG